jgi:hypothetical protein
MQANLFLSCPSLLAQTVYGIVQRLEHFGKHRQSPRRQSPRGAVLCQAERQPLMHIELGNRDCPLLKPQSRQHTASQGLGCWVLSASGNAVWNSPMPIRCADLMEERQQPARPALSRLGLPWLPLLQSILARRPILRTVRISLNSAGITGP